jgi:hypothetical protein
MKKFFNDGMVGTFPKPIIRAEEGFRLAASVYDAQGEDLYSRLHGKVQWLAEAVLLGNQELIELRAKELSALAFHGVWHAADLATEGRRICAVEQYGEAAVNEAETKGNADCGNGTLYFSCGKYDFRGGVRPSSPEGKRMSGAA